MAVSNDKILLELGFKQASESQKAINDYQKSINTITLENRKLRTELTELAKQGKGNTSEYKNLSAQIKVNNQTVSNYNTKIHDLEKSMGLQFLTTGQLSKRLKELRQEQNNVNKTLEPKRWKELSDQISQTHQRISKLNSVFQDTQALKKWQMAWGAFFGDIYTKSLDFLISSIKSAISKITDFEYANANLAAVLGTTQDGVKELTADAKRLGESTEYTASQVTQLQTELAKLGYGQEDIKNMTQYVLQFSTATGANLPQAAALAGAALRMFGANTEETQRYVSAMAVATTKSALNFSFLENAMSTVGPVANAFGFSIEETTALLGTLANAGFDASSAATATRNILLNLADSNGKLAVALGKPITSLDELAPALQELENKGISLNETLELTDKRSVAAFNTFLTNAESITILKDSITDVGEEMENMQKTKLNTVQGSVQLLSSAWEGLMLSFYDSKGFMKIAVDMLTSLVGWITRNLALIGTAIKLLGIYLGVRKLVNVANAQGVTGLKSLITFLGNYIKSIGAAIKSLFAQKVATDAADVAQSKLNATMKKNIFILIATLIIAAIAALLKYIKTANEATEAEKIRNSVQERTVELEKEKSASIMEEKNRLNGLVKAIIETNDNEKLRESLIKRLNEEFPNFLKNIGDEKISNELLKTALEDVNYQYQIKIEKMRNVAKQQAISDAITKSLERQLEIENELAKGGLSNKQIEKLNSEYKSLTNSISFFEKKSQEVIIELEKQEAQVKRLGTSDYYASRIENAEGYIQTQQRIIDNEKDMAKSQYRDVNSTIISDAQKNIDEQKEYIEGYKKFQENALKEETAVVVAEQKKQNKERQELTEKQIKAKEKARKDAENAELEAEKTATLKKLNNKKEELKNSKDYDEKIKEESLKIAIESFNAQLQIIKKYHGEESKEYETARQNIIDKEQELNKFLTDSAKKKSDATKKAAEETVKQLQKSTDAQIETIKNSREEELYQLERKKKQGIITEKNYEKQRYEINKRYNELIVVSRQLLYAEIQKLIENGAPIDDAVLEQIHAKIVEVIKKTERATTDFIDNSKKSLSQLAEYLSDIDFGSDLANSFRDAFSTAFSAIDQLRNNQNKSWTDWAMGIGSIVQGVVGAISATVTQAHELETASLEVEKNKQLALAGDNADKRSAVEKEYAQKELDLKKKQAKSNLAIQIMQAIASGAMAIITAFAQLGPIAGAIAAVIVGGITALQIATMSKQNQAIQAQTLDGTGGNTSPPKTGTVQLKEEFKNGGYADGGYTGNGGKYEVAGTASDGLPVHKGEYVIAQEEMHNPSLVPMIRAIDAERTKRTHGNSLPSNYGGGYAAGGFVGSSPNAAPQASGMSQEQFIKAMQQAMNGVKLDFNMNEFKTADRDFQTLENFTSK
ncbi:MAG: phage tail tape measure protein [Prevotellaceae bacterium]|jgi:TP901 family phage tail tape measure protein|nr:phage tail tape measure protein [Prevotellaceae bacterium]